MLIGFEAKLEKTGNWYASEVKHLCLFNQGKTQKEAISELVASLSEILDDIGVEDHQLVRWEWIDRKKLIGRLFIPVSQLSIAFVLRQLRAYKKVSLTESASIQGFKGKNSVAAYEKYGGREPSFTKMLSFFETYGVNNIKISA